MLITKQIEPPQYSTIEEDEITNMTLNAVPYFEHLFENATDENVETTSMNPKIISYSLLEKRAQEQINKLL